MPRFLVGTASWAVPRDHAGAFPPPDSGSALARYARVLPCCEINSTFWRRHRASTFERWHATVPRAFRFAVKLPRTITHEGELTRPRPLLQEFFADVAPLGEKLGPVLVQLPPSLAFEPRRVGAFFRNLRALHAGPIACEPRHPSWYGPKAHALLVSFDVARVAADPPRPGDARDPAGSASLVYHRLHGSPRPYYSEYGEDRVAAIVERLRAAPPKATVWCIYDNTASGAAAGDALRAVRMLIQPRGCASRC